jgi:hypothetical protein
MRRSCQTGNNPQRQQHTYTISGSRGGQPLEQAYNICFRKEASQSNYMDIAKIMDRCAIQQKKGAIVRCGDKKLVMEWQDVRGKVELNLRPQLTGK